MVDKSPWVSFYKGTPLPYSSPKTMRYKSNITYSGQIQLSTRCFPMQKQYAQSPRMIQYNCCFKSINPNNIIDISGITHSEMSFSPATSQAQLHVVLGPVGLFTPHVSYCWSLHLGGSKACSLYSPSTAVGGWGRLRSRPIRACLDIVPGGCQSHNHKPKHTHTHTHAL